MHFYSKKMAKNKLFSIIFKHIRSITHSVKFKSLSKVSSKLLKPQKATATAITPTTIAAFTIPTYGVSKPNNQVCGITVALKMLREEVVTVARILVPYCSAANVSNTIE